MRDSFEETGLLIDTFQSKKLTMNTEKIKSFIYYDEDKELYINVYQTTEGKICKYFLLEDPISKQTAAYISMKRDLHECLESIEYLKSINHVQQIPQHVKRALLFSSIVLYARCFTSGEGRGTSLNKRDVFKGARDTLLEFHNQTMELRHKHLAHAGNSNHESRAMVLILNPDEYNKKIESIKYAGGMLKDDDENIDNYIALINSVRTHVNEKVEKLKKVVSQKSEELNLDEVYGNSKVPEKGKLIPFTLDKVKE